MGGAPQGVHRGVGHDVLVHGLHGPGHRAPADSFRPPRLATVPWDRRTGVVAHLSPTVEIEVRVLGPVEVDRGDGRAERVPGLAARLLLALIVDRGRSVDDDVLVERLWPDSPPRHAIASVRNQVARLRRSFAPDIIGRDHAGYRVGAVLPRLDVDRLQRAVDDARGAATDASSAAEAVDRALGLVRGRPLHEVADDVWAMPAAVGIAEQVAAAEELWASLVLAAGGPVDVAPAAPRRARPAASRGPVAPAGHRPRRGRPRHGGAAFDRRRPPGPRRLRDGALS